MEEIPSLPRALDPNKFAALREPEITSLCQAVQTLLGDKYGVGGLPRQLRRRTRSHNAYTHRRRPNAKLEAARQQEKDAARLCGAEAAAIEAQAAAPAAECTNRAMRRRPGRLQAQNLEAARWTEAALEPTGGPRRLETHLWHAKRLCMVSRWGWVLPEGEQGVGMGSRAFARRLGAGAVVHDASYWCPLLLAGAAGAVHAVLQQVQDPAEAAAIMADCSGGQAWEVEAMLYGQRRYPRGAIGPARLQLLPRGALGAESSDGVHLCLWVHTAAVEEAHRALATCAACVEGARLSVLDLRRLEIRGSRASEALASILPSQGGGENGHTGAVLAVLANLEAGEAAHMVLLDPRLAKPVAWDEAAGLPSVAPPPPAWHLLQPSVPQPLSEAALSSQRHEQRRSVLCLDDPFADVEAPGGEAVAEDALAAGGATHFPMLVVRQESTHAAHSGWSVILPPGWVPPVWMSLVFSNCKPAGQREWHWLHTLEGVPFFPNDAPDTAACAASMEKLAAEQLEKEARRPKGQRSPSVAPPPPWHSLEDLAAPAEGEMDVGMVGGAEPHASIFVARSEGAVSAALWGTAGADPVLGRTLAARPVVNALAAGSLRWRPRVPPAVGSRLCLVEALVHVVKQGVAAAGAEVCVIVASEAERQTKPCYLPSGSGGTEAAGELPDPGAGQVINPGDVRIIGYVCSPAPHGMPRTAPSLAVCCAAAVWRLRALQHYPLRRDRGTVQAWMRNQESTALFPVRLSLRIERP